MSLAYVTKEYEQLVVLCCCLVVVVAIYFVWIFSICVRVCVCWRGACCFVVAGCCFVFVVVVVLGGCVSCNRHSNGTGLSVYTERIDNDNTTSTHNIYLKLLGCVAYNWHVRSTAAGLYSRTYERHNLYNYVALHATGTSAEVFPSVLNNNCTQPLYKYSFLVALRVTEIANNTFFFLLYK